MTTVFRHAVASFEPTDRAVLLWTRLTGATSARWTLAADSGLSQVVAAGDASTGPDADSTVVVDVDGLQPGTSYWYRFESAGERSPVGRTRTLPAAPAAAVRIGVVCCARYSMAPLGAYRAMAEREVDLVLHLGDYVYEDDGHKGPRSHQPPRAATTLDDYRARLAQIRMDSDCQALHLRHPMVLALDDHDVADNCWAGGAKNHDPSVHGPWADRARAAARARQEWAPARLRDPADPTATWRSVPIADLAEIVVVDTRLSGRDLQAGDEGAKELHDPGRSLLGDQQRDWLGRRLTDTSRPWSLLASGVVVNEISLPLPATSLINALIPNGYAAIEGKVMHDDQWDGYPAERDRLAGWLAERGRAGGRTVIVSGDIHSSWAFEGPPGPDGDPVAVEMTVPAVASKPMGRSRVPGAWRVLDGLVRRLEHVPWVDVTERGYGLLDVTPDEVRMEWWFVEATGADPSTGAELGKAYATAREGWPPRLAEVGAASADPVRAGLPGPLPDRPADLASLRRRHHLRQLFARFGGGAMALVAVRVALRAATAGRGRRASLRRGCKSK